MGQPKKPTYKQRKERALLAEAQRQERELQPLVQRVTRELRSIYRALESGAADAATWRWAALEVFHGLHAEPDHACIRKLRERALDIAREAQAVVNWRS